MEAGQLAGERNLMLSERFANAADRFSHAPGWVKAAAGVLLLDLVLVLADRLPDSIGEWALLLVIFAATVAAITRLEANPAGIAAVVLATSSRSWSSTTAFTTSPSAASTASHWERSTRSARSG